jgi:hypothetical protein
VKAIALFYLMLVLSVGIGWVLNIVDLFSMSFSTLTGEVVLRVVGVFIPPLGAILGWFFNEMATSIL